MEITREQKLEWKNQALLERVSEITTSYENKVADLRVELTGVSQGLEQARAEIERLTGELAEAQTTNSEEVSSD